MKKQSWCSKGTSKQLNLSRYVSWSANNSRDIPKHIFIFKISSFFWFANRTILQIYIDIISARHHPVPSDLNVFNHFRGRPPFSLSLASDIRLQGGCTVVASVVRAGTAPAPKHHSGNWTQSCYWIYSWPTHQLMLILSWPFGIALLSMGNHKNCEVTILKEWGIFSGKRKGAKCQWEQIQSKFIRLQNTHRWAVHR